MTSKLYQEHTIFSLYFRGACRGSAIHNEVLANQVVFHLQHKISKELSILFKLNPLEQIHFEFDVLKVKVSCTTPILLSNQQIQEISTYFAKNKGELAFTGIKVRTNITELN